jgi:hypothetical protein
VLERWRGRLSGGSRTADCTVNFPVDLRNCSCACLPWLLPPPCIGWLAVARLWCDNPLRSCNHVQGLAKLPTWMNLCTPCSGSCEAIRSIPLSSLHRCGADNCECGLASEQLAGVCSDPWRSEPSTSLYFSSCSLQFFNSELHATSRVVLKSGNAGPVAIAGWWDDCRHNHVGGLGTSSARLCLHRL